MSILDRYGIKEVADVTFYEINETTGDAGKPVLYLDTLKVSTIEQTAEQAEARGGKGNPPLISWDYGKEINVTLEDALFSAKSMAIMFGDGSAEGFGLNESSSLTVKKTLPKTAVTNGQFTIQGVTYNIPGDAKYYTEEGNNSESSENYAYVTFDWIVSGASIDISANSFPGTYYVTGDTYARSETTGKDEFFQFVIRKAKVQSENTITLEAEGDPSVFNMSLRVLRPTSGPMMQLIKYNPNSEAEKNIYIKVKQGASLNANAKVKNVLNEDDNIASVEDGKYKIKANAATGKCSLTGVDENGNPVETLYIEIEAAEPANG